MKTKYVLTVMAIVAITKASYAQYSQDVIRYSTFQPGSTARIKAIGNATTAIGGDLSSISGNPAGLGFFTKSELSITPEFDGQSAKTSYLAQSNSASTNNLNFNNAAIVIYAKLNTPRGANKEDGWLSLNFGASYNRTNDYYQDIYYAGNNNANSISNYYANLANSEVNSGQTFNFNNPTYLQEWAYAHNLIDQYSNGGPTYQSNVFPFGTAAGSKSVSQNNSIIREGGQTEFSFAMGANYGNQFYIGFGLGVTSLRYVSDNTFNESGVASVLNASNVAVNANYNSAYTQSQTTSGSGFNARLGVIFKPDPAFRIGASITTPTWYTINDDYAESLNTKFTSGISNSYSNGPGDYQLNYTFSTPWKVSGGLAVFLGKIGFITGDVEYLDYSTVRIDDTDGYSSSSDNHDIRTLYRSAVNAHVGAEIKADKLYFRGGYGIQGNPQRNYGSDMKTISGGVGYRFGNYYLDATYANIQGSQSIFPYVVSTATPQANVSNTYNDVFITFGVRF